MPKGLPASSGVASFASLLAALFFCAEAAPAQAPTRPADATGKEREVVWYTAMNTPDTAPLRKRFREKYPELNLTILRQPGEKIRTRILTEMRAGKFFWDVVSFNHLDIDALAQEGLLAAYASPETRSGFPAGAVDPQGRWAAIYVRQYVIGYNTRSVPPSEAPKSWEDLLQPRWKEKFAMDESDVEWYAAMLDYLGRERGPTFMRSLARQNPQFRRGHSLLARLLIAGDFPLALVHAAEMEEAKRAGAPVDWVRTLDPVITSPSQVAVSARAPHPNAGRLLVDLLLSAEGQALIRDRGRVPARSDVVQGPASIPLKLHYVNPRLAREADRHEKEFREIFLRGR
ncbi:MAG TPA: extracellular solute-binding protein [Burkholderiales bacterium]|jgi:iron(III) transport system substrate-binding protein|nr:extracellular solute-binding protein [Burkholderiales bacterium]